MLRRSSPAINPRLTMLADVQAESRARGRNMQVGGLSGAEVALRILTRQTSATDDNSKASSQSIVAALDVGSASRRTSSASFSGIHALGPANGEANAADTVANVKAWAQMAQFQNA